MGWAVKSKIKSFINILQVLRIKEFKTKKTEKKGRTAGSSRCTLTSYQDSM
ncbi:hypothetical protein F383_01788 [Gossypium arboreum]|uniref:Uncharacterized protein n=1 Tax=Gossypium arboreum TaxID=29729 RepID=A0A0B0PNH6_GOSAR|nr:hypothetical protein F383_01788 [Gossypium arboreum]